MITIRDLLDTHGGLRAGHTAFRSGEHGDGWVEKGALISNPAQLPRVVAAQAQTIRQRFAGAEIVVGCGECGAALALLVALQLELRLALTLRDPDGGLTFHRMFEPPAGSAVVLVDDLVFSGRDVRDHAAYFAARGLRFLGVSAWCARASANTGGVTVETLMPPPFETFPADACPLCSADVPIRWHGIRE